MDWQQLAALALVGLTAGILLWRWFRPRRFDFHRATGCGCSTANPPGLIVEGRRGESPRVILKSTQP